MIQKLICCKREMVFSHTVVTMQEYYPYCAKEYKQVYSCPACQKEVELWLI